MKPSVMSLAIFTCAVGLLTSGAPISIVDLMIGIILVAVGAGSSRTLGCVMTILMAIETLRPHAFALTAGAIATTR